MDKLKGSGMSSKERLLKALAFEQTDHVPCCFMGWSALMEKCADYAEYLDKQIEMGMDAVARVSEMPVRCHPDVKTREWLEPAPAGEPYPILHKEYETPAGTLTTSVNKSDEWPHGDHVPIWDDYLISHSRKFLVTPEESLDALKYILGPPTDEDVVAFRERAAKAKALADERGLMLTAAYVPMGDMSNWFAGIQEVMMATIDKPEFVHELLAIIEEWNKPFIKLALECGADLIIRRGWYENADFWSPPMHREFLLPSLKRQADMAHERGAKFGYLVSCSSMPLLDNMMEAGVDVLLGIDPAQDHAMDLALLKQKTAGKMALWGGVCGYLTIECGTSEDIRNEVRQSITTLAPGSGFILSPVTNIREGTDRAWQNAETLIETWHEMRGKL